MEGLYVSQAYDFKWNKRNNLEGFDRITGQKTFTWQPHGSQFTIHEHLPDNILILKIKSPEVVDKETILNATGFNPSWVTVISK